MDFEAAASGYFDKVRNACRAPNERPWEVLEERKSALIKELHAEPAEVQIAFIRMALANTAALAPGPAVPETTALRRVLSGLIGKKETLPRFNWMEFNLLGGLVSGTLRRKLPIPSDELARIVHSWAEQLGRINHCFSLPTLIGRVESAERTSVLEAAMLRLKAAHAIVTKTSSTRETRKLKERIDRYLAPGNAPKLAIGGPWSEVVLTEIKQLPKADRWHEIFRHCIAAQSASVPSRAWRAQAEELIRGLGIDKVRECALRWLDPQVTPLTANAGEIAQDKDADYLKGFIWLLAGLADGDLCRAVADCGLACLRKIPNHGPVSARAGFACVNVLAEMPGMEPVSQLTRMRVKVRYAVALKLIEKALNAAAERAGLARDDLEDMAVPDYGLDTSGRRSEKLGDCTADLTLVAPDQVELSWKNAAGKQVKSPPAEIRQNHADGLKEIKRAATDIQKMSMAQRLRIEQFFIQERKIGYRHWRRHFIEHPLMGAIARRLIWNFENGGKQTQGIWLNGEIVSWNSRPFGDSDLTPETTVRLWHPLQSDPQTILNWRCLLEDHHVVQPFKQAHREIYILTPAEEQTATYSNRFAAHAIRQHQFASLCRERGWRYHLMGQGFDGHNVPTLEVPGRAITAEFWVETPEQDVGTDPRHATHQTTGSGINLYLITDQVRFYRERAPLPLAEIPPVVFSEIMRDVDLFVGVTSIGNDPQWLDRGENAHGRYWREFAFGELTQAGETRRAVLEKLLPQLKISSRCSLEGRYLIVRGDLHTYKIHLGSSNVLMEPGSRYLCIVPGRGQGWERGSLYLPFEGDQTMAIILSKAFLLAADTKITDSQILAQMRRPGISIQ